MLLILVAGVAGYANLTLASGVIKGGRMVSVAATTRMALVNVRRMMAMKWVSPMIYTSRCDRLAVSLSGSRFESFLATPVVLDNEYPGSMNGLILTNEWAQQMISERRGARTMSVVDCQFVKCQTSMGDGGASSGRSGGALFLRDDTSKSSVVTIENSNFTECHSRVGGGAIFANGIKSLSIVDCNFNKCVNDRETGGAIFCYALESVDVEYSSFVSNQDNGGYPGIISVETCTTTRLMHLIMSGSVFSNANRKNAADINVQLAKVQQQQWQQVQLNCICFINPQASDTSYIYLAGTQGWFHLLDCYFEERTFKQAVMTESVFAVSTHGIHENERNSNCILRPTATFTDMPSETLTDEASDDPTSDEPTEASQEPSETEDAMMTSEITSMFSLDDETATTEVLGRDVDEPQKLSIDLIAVITACCVLVVIVIVVVAVTIYRRRRRVAFREPNPDPLDEGAYNVPFD